MDGEGLGGGLNPEGGDKGGKGSLGSAGLLQLGAGAAAQSCAVASWYEESHPTWAGLDGLKGYLQFPSYGEILVLPPTCVPTLPFCACHLLPPLCHRGDIPTSKGPNPWWGTETTSTAR